MFVENIEKAQAQINELQRQLTDWERRHGDLATGKRQAEQKAYEATELADKLAQDVRDRDRTISGLRQIAENVTLLEQRANTAEDESHALFAKASKLEDQLASSTKKLRQATERAQVAEQTLQRRQDEFDRAQRLLSAFEARAEADRVIAG